MIRNMFFLICSFFIISSAHAQGIEKGGKNDPLAVKPLSNKGPSGDELHKAAMTRINNINTVELRDILKKNPLTYLIDVRTVRESYLMGLSEKSIPASFAPFSEKMKISQTSYT